MKNKKYEMIIDEITDKVMSRLMERIEMTEGSGFDTIFQELKKELEKINILPDNRIDGSYYTEKQIVDALKSMGYDYKKAIGNKLHFFNKATSISLYVLQPKNIISLIP